MTQRSDRKEWRTALVAVFMLFAVLMMRATSSSARSTSVGEHENGVAGPSGARNVSPSALDEDVTAMKRAEEPVQSEPAPTAPPRKRKPGQRTPAPARDARKEDPDAAAPDPPASQTTQSRVEDSLNQEIDAVAVAGPAAAGHNAPVAAPPPKAPALPARSNEIVVPPAQTLAPAPPGAFTPGQLPTATKPPDVVSNASPPYEETFKMQCDCTQPAIFVDSSSGSWPDSGNDFFYPVINANADDQGQKVAQPVDTSSSIKKFVAAFRQSDSTSSNGQPPTARVLFVGDSIMQNLFTEVLAMAIEQNVGPRDELANMFMTRYRIRDKYQYTWPQDDPSRPDEALKQHPLYLRFEHSTFLSKENHNVDLTGAMEFEPTHIVLDRGAWDLVHGVPHDPGIPLIELSEVLVHLRKKFGGDARIVYFSLPRLYSEAEGAKQRHNPNFLCTTRYDQDVFRDALYCAVRSANSHPTAPANVEFFDTREVTAAAGVARSADRDGIHPNSRVLQVLTSLLFQSLSLPRISLARRRKLLVDVAAGKVDTPVDRLPLYAFVAPPLPPDCPIGHSLDSGDEHMRTLRRVLRDKTRCIKWWHAVATQGYSDAASQAIVKTVGQSPLDNADATIADTSGIIGNVLARAQLDDEKLLALLSPCTTFLMNWGFHFRSLSGLAASSFVQLRALIMTNYGDAHGIGAGHVPPHWLRNAYLIGRECIAMNRQITPRVVNEVLWPQAIAGTFPCSAVWQIASKLRALAKPIAVNITTAVDCIIKEQRKVLAKAGIAPHGEALPQRSRMTSRVLPGSAATERTPQPPEALPAADDSEAAPPPALLPQTNSVAVDAYASIGELVLRDFAAELDGAANDPEKRARILTEQRVALRPCNAFVNWMNQGPASLRTQIAAGVGRSSGQGKSASSGKITYGRIAAECTRIKKLLGEAHAPAQ